MTYLDRGNGIGIVRIAGLNRVISIDKKKLGTINKRVLKLKELIPKEYTSDEKLFLISTLLTEELEVV